MKTGMPTQLQAAAAAVVAVAAQSTWQSLGLSHQIQICQAMQR